MEGSRETTGWQEDFDAALALGRRRIACPVCHWTIGYYRPARIEKRAVEPAVLWLKCMRRGCRTAALVTLDEVDIHD